MDTNNNSSNTLPTSTSILGRNLSFSQYDFDVYKTCLGGQLIKLLLGQQVKDWLKTQFKCCEHRRCVVGVCLP